MRSWPLLLLLLCARADAAELTDEVVVERVVAVVGHTPITRGQVAFEAAMRDRVAAAPNRERFGRLLSEPWVPLEALIFRLVLTAQPVTRDTPVPDDATARERLQAFASTFPNDADFHGFLVAWRLTEAVLLDWFRDTVRMDHAIVAAVDPLVRTSRPDELRYYEENRDRIFAGRPMEEVEAYVGRQVYVLQFQRAWQGWASQIRAASRVRYVGRSDRLRTPQETPDAPAD